MNLRALSIAIIATVLAACTAAPGSSPDPSRSPAPPPTGSPVATASPTGTGADVAVVKIEQVGGMLPPWMTLAFYPSVALYGDGRLIMEGPQIELYPGPALPNLQVSRISQRGVGQVLDWAAEAGMSGEDRQLGQPLLDAGVTQFTIVRAEGAHRTTVTNLGEGTPEIAAAAQFLELMQNLRQWLPDEIAGGETPYEWSRLRVVSSPADPTTIADPQLVSELDWPLGDLATLGKSLSEPAQYRCFVIEGADLALLRPLVADANELTMWNSGGTAYQLQLHPQLPDDQDCPGF
jgi:hypothetical protein